MNEHLLMLGRFVRSPRTVGAVAPSSRALAAEMVRDLDLSGKATVVELGPGTGVITRAIAAKLGPEAHAIAVDIEPEFVAAIGKRYPRIEAVCASAADLAALLRERNVFPADHILSGLPFASLPADITTSILDAIASSLRPGGTFTTFQYLNGYPTPLASTFRQAMTDRMGEPPARRVVWRNLPPAFVLTWRHQ
jgi:phosphatidylethanolamine/phosphatidyl-N-methylethanolamine N-methyltransferase